MHVTKIHQLYREQFIDTDLTTAWDFISSPKNLDAITPQDMTFEIVTELPEKMFNGLLIEYRVGIPVLGRQPWVSEIKHICPQHSFVDEQRIGPYKLWYHYHEISMYGSGVRFVDRVNYVLPFGPLGAIAHSLYVKNQLEYIFNYREAAMHEKLSRCATAQR